jgi:hypothetical protein
MFLPFSWLEICFPLIYNIFNIYPKDIKALENIEAYLAQL